MLRFRHRSEDDDYQDSLAIWQIEHRANRHDMTPEQDARYHQHAVALNAGLDPQHVEFARYLVKAGALSDDERPTEQMIRRAVAVRETGRRPGVGEGRP